MEIDKLYEQLNAYVLQNFTLFWTIIIGVFAIIGVALYFLAQSLTDKGIKKSSQDFQAKNDDYERRLSSLENSLRETSKALEENINSRAKIGSTCYIGNGLYGMEHPCALTFSFAPKVIMISTEHSNPTSGILLFQDPKESQKLNFVSAQDGDFQVNMQDTHCGINGSTVNWYNSKNAASQFNSSGISYYCIAIG